MKHLFSLLILLASITVSAANNAKYVIVFIGTDGTGHTFPGPSMPFGMVQPGPDNISHGWNNTSGYQYKDTAILGFSQTRFNGTGINEMGDILLLPFSGGENMTQGSGYKKTSEKGSVGHYTVTMNDGVKIELTCSQHVAFHKYTFPSTKGKVFADFQHGLRFLTDSLVLDSDIKIDDDKTISGYCHTKNWVERKYFFVIKFDTPFYKSEIRRREAKENAPKQIFSFNLEKSRKLKCKIALSSVSIESASQNMQTEIPDWDFNQIHQKALSAWNNYLNRIDIKADQRQKETFYTSLYHLLLQPSNIADVSGEYRGADDKIALAPNHEYYSTLSIWDIYRGAFPLLEIIAPEKIDGIIQSLLLHQKAAGFLPIWTAWGQDNYCMIGNHAIPMILSAVNNGFKGFDKQEALKAMITSSTKSHINSNWELYNKYGYYPFDIVKDESVSRTLESSYDDWCVSQMAKELGDTITSNIFQNRANYYKKLYDPSSKMFRGKDSRGNWRSPFDPLMATSPMNNPGDYTEANAWQYFWTPAQSDINGVKQLLGGDEPFTKQLNDFFTIESANPNKFLGQEAMIGQYAHGNEPSHHVIYLYAYSKSPKTGQKHIHQVVTKFHNNTPNGMIGNDDCGQMSAWYILSTLGFYPINGASNEFVIGAPQFRKATIHLTNGKNFTIDAHNISTQNIYTEKQLLNNQIIEKPYITYQEIQRGGVLKFEMTNK